MTRIHHAGIYPADLEASLRFYRDGVGLDVLVDAELETDVEPLLGVATSKVRTVFLGSRAGADAGIVELLALGGDGVADEPPASGLPRRGVFLVSFVVPVEATLARLAEMGMGGTPRRMPTPAGGLAATVVDPDGVTVELLDAAPFG